MMNAGAFAHPFITIHGEKESITNLHSASNFHVDQFTTTSILWVNLILEVFDVEASEHGCFLVES
jgi:hypothetical protein